MNSVYNPQRDSYNAQINAIDPQLEAEQKGLQAQKTDSFQQITDQANRRGLFYSGLPVQEEQRYTGTQFLPAVANLHAKYANQKFGLQDALAKITADQYNQAYNIRGKEEELDLQRQLANEAAARDAAARASAGGGGGGLSFGGAGAAAAAPAQQAQPDYFSLIQQLRQSNPGQWTWGKLAQEFDRRGIDTKHTSAADLALNAYFNQGGGYAANQAGAQKLGGGGGRSF